MKKNRKRKNKGFALITAILALGVMSMTVALNILPVKNNMPSYLQELAIQIAHQDIEKMIEPHLQIKPPIEEEITEEDSVTSLSLDSIPSHTNSAFVPINNNIPTFSDSLKVTTAYEHYAPLDALGRTTQAKACLSTRLMPTEDRENISSVKPSGWQSIEYEHISGDYLYNRSHLIGFQLSAENANPNNLITGTRYLNVEGMLPFENMVADYIKESNHHVLYEVTPIYEHNNLVASGVHMQAYSIEDQGAGISFNVYIYNVQPGVEIDYATGNSQLATQEVTTQAPISGPSVDDNSNPIEYTYILNTNSRKFHYSSCSSVKQIADHNKSSFSGVREALITQGYDPCQRCHP